jgi:RNA polymerase-binding transcription factor
MDDHRKRRTGELRNLLVRLREDLRERVKSFRVDQEQEALSSPGDEMDAAKSLADVETHATLIDRKEDQLFQVESALTRLDQGEYGICMNCGEEIPIERLKAIPFAIYCIDCQKKAGSARSLSVTERRAIRQWSPPPEADEKELLSDDGGNAADQLDVQENDSDEREPAEEPGRSQVRRRGRPRINRKAG